ncbi:MAG: hypothetical protein ACFCVE_11570 [Phycisphaerae bacterium]
MENKGLPDDFKDLLKCLSSHGVRYLVIGGYAVVFHGYPRVTNELDVWLAVDPANSRAVHAALSTFFKQPLIGDPEKLVTPGSMLRFGHPPL